MKTWQEGQGPETLANEHRRQFLKGGMAVGATVAGAAIVSASASETALAAAAGPPRKIMWVTHSIGEWNLALDVGFYDFCEQAGWTYQKVGVPGGSYSAEDNVNKVKLAVQAKPDVIISTITNPAVEAPLVEAEAAGILVILNNSSIEEIRAAHNWGFVGAGGYDQGLIVGRGLAKWLVDHGKSEGVIVFGNAEPGHPVLNDRKLGGIAALEETNTAQGTKFTVQEFADQSHDIAQSIPLYSSVMKGLGNQFIGFMPSGYSSMVAAFRMLEDSGFKPGDYPIAGTDTGPEINEGIEKGYINIAVEQELYNQGYLSAAAAWARLERLNIPPVMNTGTAIVTQDNLKFFADRTQIVLDRANELGIRL
ncbi:MAG TPA: substrate-binding domain-containing protein [Bauldia sp.]|nr:substrate-binding domain-containing protein [Bauldia sp.]